MKKILLLPLLALLAITLTGCNEPPTEPTPEPTPVAYEIPTGESLYQLDWNKIDWYFYRNYVDGINELPDGDPEQTIRFVKDRIEATSEHADRLAVFTSRVERGVLRFCVPKDSRLTVVNSPPCPSFIKTTRELRDLVLTGQILEGRAEIDLDGNSAADEDTLLGAIIAPLMGSMVNEEAIHGSLPKIFAALSTTPRTNPHLVPDWRVHKVLWSLKGGFICMFGIETEKVDRALALLMVQNQVYASVVNRGQPLDAHCREYGDKGMKSILDLKMLLSQVDITTDSCTCPDDKMKAELEELRAAANQVQHDYMDCWDSVLEDKAGETDGEPPDDD